MIESDGFCAAYNCCLAIFVHADYRWGLHAHVNGKTKRQQRSRHAQKRQHHRAIGICPQGAIVFVVAAVAEFFRKLSFLLLYFFLTTYSLLPYWPICGV